MAASDVQAGHDSPGRAHVRGPVGYNAADYAWEFLRRNPDYRAEFEHRARHSHDDSLAIDPRWGLRFAADPTSKAPEAEVFWRPDVAPGIVLPLEADERGEARPWRPLQTVGNARQAEDGWHLRLRNGLQLLLRGEARPDGPLVVVLTFDRDYGLRLRAAQALNRTAGPPKTRLTPARRRRLDQALRALDGALEKASYRTIAQSLFGEAAVEREPWKTASVRDTTIRLVRAGEGLMRGGYLKLLRGGF